MGLVGRARGIGRSRHHGGGGLAAVGAMLAMGIIAGLPTPGQAHPPSLLSQASREAIGEEVLEFRRRMAAAIAIAYSKSVVSIP